jgi:glycerol kinase
MSKGSQTALYLALDQGGHASRAIVFDAGGGKLAEASRPIDTLVEGERVELDPQQLLDSLRQSAEDACRQLGGERHRIRAAGLATQRSNIACWRRDSGEAIGPVLSWQDRRAPEYLQGLEAAQVHERTGLFPNPHYGASKLAWCLAHGPGIADAAARGELLFGPMASFLASRLGNAPAVADPANASRTLLWNLHTREWDGVLCQHFGIDPSLLPPVAYSRHDFGRLEILDLSIPLTVVTGDLSAAAFVHGAPQPQRAYVTVGTGAFVQRLSRQPPDGAPRLLNGVVWDDGHEAWYSLEGTVNGAGSALAWLARQHGVDEGYIQEHLPNWCVTEQTPPLFLNGVSGLGSPHWRAGFTSRFIGEGGLAAQAVAVLESIVFLLVENLRSMSEVLSTPDSLVVSGGLSQLDSFCRRLADLSGLVVNRSGETEGTAKGLAYLLAGMPERWQRLAGDRFEPGQDEAGPITERYRQWQAQMQAALSILADQ